MKCFGYFTLFLTMLITACGNIPGLGPIATSTSLPTITPPPTNTPTQMPTATPLPSPTATEVLSPQEQHNHDFGDLVPKGEKCVNFTEGTISNMDVFPLGVEIAELKLHATGNEENVDIKTITIPWGEEKIPREVEVLRVVGRCDGTNIDLMWLVLGGEDFGKNKDGTAVYWYIADNGGLGRKVTTVQELKKKIIEGLEIGVTIPVKIESSSVRDHFGDYYGLDGYSNELTNGAIRTFAENKTVIDQLVQGAGINQEDYILYPLMITVDTDIYNLP